MTQLIAEQVLVAANVGGETERPERAATLRLQVPDTSLDQDANKVVVKRPPCVMITRHGHFDEAYRVVDDRSNDRERVTVLVARDHQRYLRPRDQFRPGVRQSVSLRVGQ